MRYDICMGINKPYAVLDTSTYNRVSEHGDLDAARDEMRRLNNPSVVHTYALDTAQTLFHVLLGLPHNLSLVNLLDAGGRHLDRLQIERETLTDGSQVYNFRLLSTKKS